MHGMNRKTIGQSVAVFLAVLALLFSAGSAIAGGRGSLPQSPGEPIRAFLPGPLGHQAVAEDQPGRGFLLLRLDGQPGVHFQGFPHAGKQVSWSPDGRWIGFKQIASGQQVAMVYDTRSGRLLDLTAPSPRCGVPSFADRLVAVSRGTRVLLYDRNFRLLREIGLGHYANLVRLSPDGQRLAWNDSDDQIWITWLATGKSRRISDGTQGYFNPLWQPRGGGLLFQGWNEQLFYYSPASGRVKNLGAGAHPSWSPDGQWVFCSRATWGENGFIADRDIWAVRVADGWEQNLTGTPDRFEDYPAIRSGVLLFRAGDQQLFRQPLLYRNGTWRRLREEPLQQPP
ncbi:MAG TPA: hypothetical protein ENJ23_00180, partial [Bacteroidetes bacterium]|nr:hypothetical protein [Bacteroidota bacterium]